ncbi:MAG TPA: PAS domain S-box protein [Nitrospirota bacterium]|nr:PAS domain S-box protein [Nitrospirota bacterium]
MPQGGLEQRKGILIFLVALLLAAMICIGVAAGFFIARGERMHFILSFVLLPLGPFFAYVLYKKTILPSYRSLEDTNLELHLKQEELLDIKDDLFIKFLGVYDVNFAANSPRLFSDRLTDVADITARVMEADACFILLYDRKKDDLVISASNGIQEGAIGKVRIPLGEGIEGWVGRRLEPLMLKDYRADSRFREIAGFSLTGYVSVYCVPLYVYSNGALVGVMEVYYGRAKTFSDEEINFFTTLSGILATTIQNEQMQSEMRKMNIELEQWVAEKTEELRASEERYRTLVENACESIFLLAGNGDILFANEQAEKLTKYAKYDLVHKNLFEFFVGPENPREILLDVTKGHHTVRQGELSRADGSVVPVEVSGVGLSLMGKRFIQAVVRDVSDQARLEQLLLKKEQEIANLKARLHTGG